MLSYLNYIRLKYFEDCLMQNASPQELTKRCNEWLRKESILKDYPKLRKFLVNEVILSVNYRIYRNLQIDFVNFIKEQLIRYSIMPVRSLAIYNKTKKAKQILSLCYQIHIP